MSKSSAINEDRLAHVVEAICQLGCNRVEAVISGLSNGHYPDQAVGLNKTEIARLHFELIEIMKPLKHD